jgi:hypothetical protein
MVLKTSKFYRDYEASLHRWELLPCPPLPLIGSAKILIPHPCTSGPTESQEQVQLLRQMQGGKWAEICTPETGTGGMGCGLSGTVLLQRPVGKLRGS